jgi:membrane-bound lytic murein transglycosylase D
LWQFIPATGRRYGLRQTPWTDDRGNVARSTAAALEHLQRLSGNFDGDWLRAFAAYNCGTRKVRLAVRSDLANGGSGEFWSLELPRITRRYVPKLLALAQVIKDAERRADRLPELAEPEELATVTVSRPLSLDVAAELVGMTPHALWDFNADLRRPVTPPGGYALRVPASRANMLRGGLSSLPADEWMRWTEHVVQKGENLWLIARRYGVTVASLKQVNGLGSNLIKPGKALLLPPAATVSATSGSGEI